MKKRPSREVECYRILTNKKIKEEEATSKDAEVTGVSGLDTIFSFHGNPLIDELWECWEPSLTDGGWFNEESRQIDRMIQDSVCQFSTTDPPRF